MENLNTVSQKLAEEMYKQGRRGGAARRPRKPHPPAATALPPAREPGRPERKTTMSSMPSMK